MSPSQEHQSTGWSPGAPPEVEERLLRSLETTPRDDGSDDIRWTCPRCFHEHFLNVFRDQVWAGLDGSDRSAEILLRCECGFDHPDRPENEVGCGYRIVVTVTEEED